MRKRNTLPSDFDPDDNLPLNERLTFCTMCELKLEDYCFSSETENISALKEHIAECKKSGRFTGGVCARFFIANPDDLI
jgi:hypothetical protein